MEGRYMKNIFIALMTALIVSVVGIGYAQPVFEQRSLREVLNPDGTLKQGVQGSFKVEGYTMRIGKNGEPIFLPQLQSAVIGTWDTQFGLPFPGVAGDVYALAIDGNGNVYVGGRFSAVGGVNINVSNVARYNPNSGTWDNLGGGVTSSGGGFVVVYALAVSGNDVYVGGFFSQAGTGSGAVFANNVARYNPNSGTWDNLGGGVSFGGFGGQVNALAVSGNDVYVGGIFSQAGTGSGAVFANNVARYNPNSGTWDNLGGGVSFGGSGGVVNALAVSGNDVYVGGIFSQAGTGSGAVFANNVARYNPNSGTWDNLGGGVSVGGSGGVVNALAVSGNDVYVGGFFSQAGTGSGAVFANNVARYNPNSGTWDNLGGGVSFGGFGGVVNALAVSGNDVYVGGIFNQAGTGSGAVFANNVALFSAGSWRALGTGTQNGVDREVRALAVSGNDVYVGGFFNRAGSVSANNVARYDGSGWRALGSGGGNGVNGPVYALAVDGQGRVYVGGQFTQAGGSSGFNNVARYNPNSGTWDNLGGGVSFGGSGGQVNALAVSGNDVYVGGFFSQAGTGSGAVFANNVARYNPNSGTWDNLGGGVSFGGFGGQVNALAVSGNDVYVGGFFDQAGSVSANNVARFNVGTNSWRALGTGSQNGVNGFVFALAVVGNEVFVGGTFTSAGGESANSVARYNPNSGTWDNLGGGVSFGGFGGQVNALAVSGNDVYVGGFFDQAGSVSANNVARFNVGTNSWRALGTGTQSGVGGVVNALAVSGNDVYVGGFFNLAFTDGSVVFANNVALFSAGSWRALGTGTQNGVDREVRALAVSGNDVYVGGFFNRAGGVPSTFIARFIPTPPNAAATQSVTSDGLVCFSPTGVCINFTGVSGTGTCTVERYDTPPSNVAFSSSAPTNVSRYYFIITAAGFSFTQAELRFNRTQIPNAGIGNPQTVNVYRRPTPGSGTFSLLPNTFDPSAPDEVRATTTSFSEFILGSNDPDNPLPVELSAFTGVATPTGVRLQWTTQSEQNNAGFEVRRKTAGEDFVTIASYRFDPSLRGKGTTSSTTTYSFVDATVEAGKTYTYRLRSVDYDGTIHDYAQTVSVEVREPVQARVYEYALEQNYPNPFNPTTTIRYSLKELGKVSLRVYDVMGREVKVLVDGVQGAGEYSVVMDAMGLSSGVYVYQLRAGGYVFTRKMMLVK